MIYVLSELDHFISGVAHVKVLRTNVLFTNGNKSILMIILKSHYLSMKGNEFIHVTYSNIDFFSYSSFFTITMT